MKAEGGVSDSTMPRSAHVRVGAPLLLTLGLVTSSVPLFVSGWWFDVTSSGHAADLPTRVALGASGFISVIAGVIVRWRRPENPTGTWLAVSGLLGPLAFMVGSGSTWLTLASAVAFVAATCIGIAVVIGFPTGRIDRRGLALVALTGFVVALFRAQQLITSDPVATIPGWTEPNPFRLQFSGPALDAFSIGYSVLGIGYLLVFGAWLSRRWALLRGPSRRSIGPVLGGALVFVAASVVQAFVEIASPDDSILGAVRFAHTLSFSAISIGFMAGLLRVHLARSAIADLVVELGETPEPPALRRALATALRDPSLELAIWWDEGYLDERGDPIPSLEARAGNRAVTLLESAGRPLAAILHDPALLDDPGLVASVATAVRLSVDNDRLTREVASQLEETRASRARIVEAADTERRRLERDIHDGAQQRLVALSMTLGRTRSMLEVGGDGASEAAVASIADASDELRAAINDLRELARGIHPAILTQAGLEAAVGSLVERSAVPAGLTGSVGRRLPSAIEATAYFVASEALANASKHAAASEVRVSLEATCRDLTVEIRDDGCGGASIEDGRGLSGLRDRVEAVGGSLDVVSPAGRGTIIRARLPIPEGEG